MSVTEETIERPCIGCGTTVRSLDRLCIACRRHLHDAAKYDPRRATKDEILRGGEWVHDRHGIQRWRPFRRSA